MSARGSSARQPRSFVLAAAPGLVWPGCGHSGPLMRSLAGRSGGGLGWLCAAAFCEMRCAAGAGRCVRGRSCWERCARRLGTGVLQDKVARSAQLPQLRPRSCCQCPAEDKKHDGGRAPEAEPRGPPSHAPVRVVACAFPPATVLSSPSSALPPPHPSRPPRGWRPEPPCLLLRRPPPPPSSRAHGVPQRS